MIDAQVFSGSVQCVLLEISWKQESLLTFSNKVGPETFVFSRPEAKAKV